MKNKRRFFCGGFTLAEVLVVVVIIGVMATMAIPRFTGQRDKAATAEAIAIMTSIHRALLRWNDQEGGGLATGWPAALATDADIKSTLRIDYSTPKNNWTFSTDANGAVRGTNTASGGNLYLFSGGAWFGDGVYDPTSGSFWPGLSTTGHGNFTG